MVGLLGMMGRSDAVEGGSVMRRWTGPVTMLVLFSFLAGGTITQENGAAVNAIHANGAKAICYIDAGGAESFRPDYAEYQAFNANCNGCLFGKPIGGFRNEFWLNINNNLGQRTFILGEISKRLDRCVANGFDGVEMDVVDAWSNRTG